MKKLLLLPLLFNACCALAHDENIRQPVELTKRQKELLADGCGIEFDSTDVRFSHADSYHPEKYPHCVKVFELLDRYAQLNDQADKLYDTINGYPSTKTSSYGCIIVKPKDSDKAFMVSYEAFRQEMQDVLQKQIFNNETMDHYIKFAETLKENGMSKPE